jgi:hypothetical protein
MICISVLYIDICQLLVLSDRSVRGTLHAVGLGMKNPGCALK